ncbi:MAG: signal peptidase I [Marmoricola sp.]
MTHADAPFPEKQKRTKGQRKSLPLWAETILLLITALVLAVIIKSFFIQAFYIPSPSMVPTLIKNDRILVEKMSYWGGGSPQRGDIVVFGDPGGWLSQEESSPPSNGFTKVLTDIGLYPSGGHLVKRVIGVGGDRVVCCDKQGRVTVNGTPLNEKSYLPPGTKPSLTRFDVRVPQGDLWVMGDNRGDSWDSRGHMGGPGGGFVPEDLVVGKVFALVWPFSRAEIIHRPATFKDIPDN